ncbi:MAG: hypothetical protein V1495_06200 [Pseudomonadota bacterium]
MENHKYALGTVAIAITIAFTGPLSFVYADDVCSDMGRFTRAPGFYPDGTGNDGKGGARNVETEQQLIADFHHKHRKDIAERFRAILQQPDMSNFRKTAIAAFGIECDLVCKAQMKKDMLAGDPLENTANALAGLVLNSLLILGTEDMGGYHVVSDKDRRFLLANSVFKDQRKLARKKILDDAEVGDPDKTVKAVFDRVVPIMKEVVVQAVPDIAWRDWMNNRLSNIQFTGTDCGTSDQKEPELGQLLQANAGYDPVSQTFTYCRGLILLNSSEFSMAGVIAHELAHSIDPCRIAQGPGNYRFKYHQLLDPKLAAADYPIPNLIQCLRDERSVHAYRAEATNEKGTASRNILYDRAKPIRPTKSRKATYSVFCGGDGPTQMDQIPEATADWFAAEVIPRYIEKYHPDLSETFLQHGYSNYLRGLQPLFSRISEFKDPTDEHPQLEDRIDRILMAQPKIRTQLGCGEKTDGEPLYCPSEFKPSDDKQEMNSKSEEPKADQTKDRDQD